MKFFKLKMKSSSFYRIINILSLIFVIISLVFAFLLYGKRKELFDLNGKMVSTISKIAVILDNGSGTAYSKNMPGKGTKDFQALSNNLMRIEKQALDIIKQRNSMGKTLITLSENLELPAVFTPKQFQSVKEYQKSADDLVQYSKQVNERNDLLINSFINIANAIQVPLENEAAFKAANKNLHGYSDELDKLAENIIVFDDELNKTKKQFSKNAEQIKKLEKELLFATESSPEEVSTLITEYENQLEDLQKENSDLVDSIGKNQVSESSDFAEQLEAMHPDKRLEYENKLKEIKSELYLKLTGKVLKYDKKWGFAIINIGKYNEVDFTIDDNKKTATVALPINKEMYVSRENKFIAKVNVVKVVDKYAVVNLEFPPDGTIQAGDTVFFPISAE